MLALRAATKVLASPPHKYFTLNLSTRLLAPDGVLKQMMIANDVLDYAIHADTGDTVSVTVVNGLDEPTSIHWHGLYMTDTPWLDGAGMVTQPLIKPGATLTYTFSLGNQSGTFWWHSHAASQYVNGLRGPFIIHDPLDPFASVYDEEIIVTLSDNFHKSAADVLANYVNAFDPVPASGLVNGIGAYDCDFWTGDGLVCISSDPQFQVGTSWRADRLRIINTSAQAQFVLSIDSHEMIVIEADGTYTNPTAVDSLPISASQRYSVIVEASAPVDSYWLRATIMDMYTPTGSEINNGLNLNVTAVWRYTDSQSVKPTYVEVPSLTNTLNPYILGELNGLPSGVYPDSDTDIYFSFNVMPDPTFPNNATTVSTVSIISDQITFFDSQYQMPERPTLQDVLLGNPLPQSTNALVVSNEWVMLEIRNSDNIEHVFHLHGYVGFAFETVVNI
ncbi:hypothetical protein HDU82_003926 [Entophlyctis luteolus]|nr:hypothetical protein HDU82_003926 [Entophlyctis luteolus]